MGHPFGASDAVALAGVPPRKASGLKKITIPGGRWVVAKQVGGEIVDANPALWRGDVVRWASVEVGRVLEVSTSRNSRGWVKLPPVVSIEVVEE